MKTTASKRADIRMIAELLLEARNHANSLRDPDAIRHWELTVMAHGYVMASDHIPDLLSDLEDTLERLCKANEELTVALLKLDAKGLEDV